MEVTEATTNEALFGSEDLLQSLANRDTFDWMGIEEPDSGPEDGDASETGDEGAEDVLIPCCVTEVEDGVIMGRDLLDFTSGEMNGTPKVEGDDADSPATAAVGTRGDSVKEATCDTDDKAVAEKRPSTDALCEERICDDEPVPSNEGGTDAPGARH